MCGPCYCHLPHTSQNSDLNTTQSRVTSVCVILTSVSLPSLHLEAGEPIKKRWESCRGRLRGGEGWNTFSHSPKPGAPRLWAAGLPLLELKGGGDHYLLTGCPWDPRTQQGWGPLSWSSCRKWLIKVFHSADLKGSFTCVSHQRAGKAQTFGRYHMSPWVFWRMFTLTDPYWK